MDEYQIAALKFANQVRKDLKREPVGKIRPGERKSRCCCPLARTIGLGAAVDPYTTFVHQRRWNHPTNVTAFIKRFDAVRYPELLLDCQSI